MKKLLLFLTILWLVGYSQGLRFLQEYMFVTIHEEKPTGSFVAQAQAIPQPVTYGLGYDAGNFFAINSTTGEITVKNRFDRETQNFTDGTFTVYAFDNAGNKASAQVIYWILDVNDHVPQFPSQYYNVTVGEETDIDSQIFSATAIDEDVEGNGEILYVITAGNEDGMFKLKGAYHCIVLVAKPLDFESRSSYVLNISASNYQEGFSNWTVLSISVADEDDLPARFSTYEYHTFVREDAAVGTSIIQVSATDQDKLNDPVTYEMVESTNKHGLFVINYTTGVILLNGSLDREIVPDYRLQVLAYSTFHLPDHVTVEIEVGDVNDHPPVFTDNFYSFVIRENAKIGAIVGQVTATDADQGNNATFTYFMLDGKDGFAVNPETGVLVVNGSLDREKQEDYSFLVFVKETETAEQFSTNVTVEVKVEDRNDNSPRFVKPFYEVTVKEELPRGTPILRVFANDSDASSNAYVTYSLVPHVNNHSLDFSISPVNGSIITAKKLDRETIGEYYLTVKAENSAVQTERRSSTVTVKVMLQDINDHEPVFDQQFYNVTVTEAIAGNSTILTVKATDKDFEDNGEVKYSLDRGNFENVFNIDELSGAVSVVKDLDREKADVYNLVVKATDGGNKSTTVNVTVFVSDINDNSPQFTSPGGYQFYVVEEAAGLTVGGVKANDSDTGSNADIIYSLMHTPTSQRINSTTGEILTTDVLDYEKFHSHLLIVQAEDQGVPQSRRTAVQVSIIVTDVNDNAPKFVEDSLFCGTYNTTVCTCSTATKAYDFIVIRVQDLTPANTEIGKVMAFDKDKADNAQIFYRFEGNESAVFSITSRTGIIRTNRKLKRDENPVYNLTVIAENSLASPKLSTNVTVQVIVYDVGIQEPQFTASKYRAEIAESAAVGTSVIRINVTNNKQEAPSFLMFKILYDQSSAGSRKFVIEPETGLITTQGGLDRETTSNYTLIVQAKLLNKDLEYNQPSSVVPVFINVSDVDDNYPRFVQRSYWFTPSELSRVGDVIGHVTALDVDDDSKSEVFYEIASGNEKGLFNISVSQGTIYVNRSLNNEAASTFYLVIRARDTPDDGKSRKRREEDVTFDEVMVTIQVQDENNNPPVFTQTEYMGGFYEGDASLNTVLVTVQALDKDTGAYGYVQYSIVKQDDPGVFSLNSSTGEVFQSNPSAHVAGNLNYTLTISAEDNLGIAPYNRANKNASVYIFVLSDSTKLSLELDIPLEFVQEKKDEIESMLRNLTGGTVIIKDMQDTGDGRTIIYFHAIKNGTMHILTPDDFMSLLRNNTELINLIFKKWNVRVPTGPTAQASKGSKEEFSAVIAAMLVLSAGIGVAGLIGIIIACRKQKRDKTVYKTNNNDSQFPLETGWYTMDIPGIEAYIDSKAEGTPRQSRSTDIPGINIDSRGEGIRRSLTRNTKYTIQRDLTPPGSSDFALLRTPLRGSGSYGVRNQEKKKVEEKKEAVALHRYESTPGTLIDRREENKRRDTMDNLPIDATTITKPVESHVNAGFEKGQDKPEEKPKERRGISKPVETKPGKSSENGKERRVRFDLRGTKEKKAERRAARRNIPDIIVISEEAGANLELYEDEKKRDYGEEASDLSDDGDSPADASSVFEDSMMSRPAKAPAVSDEEGTVVDL